MSDKKDRYDQANEDAAQTLVRKNQVVTVRYKVYIFFLGLFLFVFRPTLVTSVEVVRGEGAFTISLLNPIAAFTQRGSGGLLSDLEKTQRTIEETEAEIQGVKIEKKVVSLLSEQEKQNTLINCLNNNICDVIDEKLIKNIKFLRVFMMMNYLGGEKMSFDQKTILRSVNEFLNKTPGGLDNGTLQGIRFETPSTVNEEYEIKGLNILVNMEFDHKRNLISFLQNTEDRVFVSLPVLYVINRINYDIVNYTERQEITIGMTIYYFDGKPPQDESPGTGEVVTS